MNARKRSNEIELERLSTAIREGDMAAEQPDAGTPKPKRLSKRELEFELSYFKDPEADRRSTKTLESHIAALEADNRALESRMAEQLDALERVNTANSKYRAADKAMRLVVEAVTRWHKTLTYRPEAHPLYKQMIDRLVEYKAGGGQPKDYIEALEAESAKWRKLQNKYYLENIHMRPVVEAAGEWNKAHCNIAAVANDPSATEQDNWKANNEHNVQMERLHEAVRDLEEKGGDAHGPNSLSVDTAVPADVKDDAAGECKACKGAGVMPWIDHQIKCTRCEGSGRESDFVMQGSLAVKDDAAGVLTHEIGRLGKGWPNCIHCGAHLTSLDHGSEPCPARKDDDA